MGSFRDTHRLAVLVDACFSDDWHDPKLVLLDSLGPTHSPKPITQSVALVYTFSQLCPIALMCSSWQKITRIGQILPSTLNYERLTVRQMLFAFLARSLNQFYPREPLHLGGLSFLDHYRSFNRYDAQIIRPSGRERVQVSCLLLDESQ
jgi:hypothetical protein